MKRLVAVAIVVVFVVAVGTLALGFLDIALGLIDNRLGILTTRAIDAVRSIPESTTNIGATVSAQQSQSVWSAYHGDDDSLKSVVVTASVAHQDPRLAPQWCVEFDFEWRSFGISVRRIAPINMAAQQIAPTLGSGFESLNPYGTSYCAGRAVIHRRRTLDSK